MPETSETDVKRRDRREPYSGYYLRDVPPHDPEITHTGPGTPMGEFMRRYWQPVCLSRQLDDLPLAIRIMGEDLVAFRDRSGRVGVLHRHCSHRGTSLEYGIVSERGIRCCYHGWLFDVDGTILETPGEPSGSRIGERVQHGAYPVREYRGLVFAYLGPAGTVPEFPIYDTWTLPDTEIHPFSIDHPCNWLQVHENIMDPVHTAFLHSTMSGIQITDAYATTPVLEFFETDDGHSMVYICSRRMPDGLVWVRNNHALLPNHIHVAAINIHADAVAPFTRAGMDWWSVPNDDTRSTVFGFRHYNDEVDPHRDGVPGNNRVNYADHIAGQTGGNPYEVQQRHPGDWEVLVGQRAIAVHALEHLGSTDQGVALLRQMLRRAARGEIAPSVPPLRRDPEGVLHTYHQDSVFRVPLRSPDRDRDYIRGLGRAITDMVMDTRSEPRTARRDRVRAGVAEVATRESGAQVAAE
jgi:phenylpropionate dioxygenase-like ring-hydroxylating dioxygenase large terminal subunit